MKRCALSWSNRGCRGAITGRCLCTAEKEMFVYTIDRSEMQWTCDGKGGTDPQCRARNLFERATCKECLAERPVRKSVRIRRPAAGAAS